ncbi:VOC family protein [Telmatospirillum sp.]|uniref:VOC family protein n=1 Tax=Telmatospirillum sp. TaxID=2079197 RepID=UPI0028476725|nr:VOC family protein [Telmatospirillum sp.]MDR3440972.1 VOC family protein [Telmatospirillum sp.]
MTRDDHQQPSRRLPDGRNIFLDHVGHFVPDRAKAKAAFSSAGFTLTPEAIHTVPGSDGRPVLAGTGNVCVMLDQGYVEVLFRTADTPLADQFDKALARHAGVHLAAFSTADAGAEAARLLAGGFSVQPPVSLSREILGQPAAFTVIRVAPGVMAEGRIQFLTHHSEAVVWQAPWLTHANGARALLDLLLVVDDVDAVAGRWSAFLGRPAKPSDGGRRIDCERGAILILPVEGAAHLLGTADLPSPPTFAAYGLEVESLAKAAAVLRQSGLAVREERRHLFVPFPAALGQGAWVMVERSADLPW